jgi:hypothetical protein
MANDNPNPSTRFGPGNRANPGGRPKVWKEYKQWIEEHCLPKAQAALLGCLEHKDGKVRMMAVKEVHDRLFGKASQHVAVTGEDGRSFGADLIPLLQSLVDKKK